jgi:hypothetical protein
VTVFYLSPNGDVTTQWNVTGSATHYGAINRTIRYPTDLGAPLWDNIYIQGTGQNKIDVFGMENPTDSFESVSQIIIRVFAAAPAASVHNIKVSISKDGSSWTDGAVTQITSSTWYSWTFAVSYSPTDINNLQVKLTSSGSGVPTLLGKPWVKEMYAECTIVPLKYLRLQGVKLAGVRLQ